ncbi:MAG: hypothetical protein ACI8PZ_006679 [Myxococcota bacterium]
MSNATERERLRQERDLFLRELVATRSTLDELTVLVAEQNDRLDEVVTMLRRREAQLARAEREIRRLRKKYGEDPEPDPPPASEPAESAADEQGADSERTESPADSGDGPTHEGASAPTAEGSSTPKSRPRSHGGRTPPPDHVDSTDELHTLCACGHCGGTNIQQKDIRSSSKIDVRPFLIDVRNIHRVRYRCSDCGTLTTAPMPPMPCESAKYTCGFIAWLVVMKFVLLVPLDRIIASLASQGVHVAKGRLVHLIERAATLAEAVDGEHWQQLKAGAFLCFDGTGLKTVIVGQCKAWDGYMEVYTRDELTVFQFDLTKHADRLRTAHGSTCPPPSSRPWPTLTARRPKTSQHSPGHRSGAAPRR